jgi:hypothetical protein
MSEIKTEIKQNDDGSYTITDAHSTSDIVRWLLTQDDKETILYLLEAPQQRKPLTDEQIKEASLKAGMQEHYMGFHSGFIRFARAIESAHGIKENT